MQQIKRTDTPLDQLIITKQYTQLQHISHISSVVKTTRGKTRNKKKLKTFRMIILRILQYLFLISRLLTWMTQQGRPPRKSGPAAPPSHRMVYSQLPRAIPRLVSFVRSKSNQIGEEKQKLNQNSHRKRSDSDSEEPWKS